IAPKGVDNLLGIGVTAICQLLNAIGDRIELLAHLEALLHVLLLRGANVRQRDAVHDKLIGLERHHHEKGRGEEEERKRQVPRIVRIIGLTAHGLRPGAGAAGAGAGARPAAAGAGAAAGAVADAAGAVAGALAAAWYWMPLAVKRSPSFVSLLLTAALAAA